MDPNRLKSSDASIPAAALADSSGARKPWSAQALVVAIATPAMASTTNNRANTGIKRKIDPVNFTATAVTPLRPVLPTVLLASETPVRAPAGAVPTGRRADPATRLARGQGQGRVAIKNSDPFAMFDVHA
jgi:hypothetical protein